MLYLKWFVQQLIKQVRKWSPDGLLLAYQHDNY